MDDIETICQNSYRNFHVKGFDYLCLSRTPELTRKVYFFDGELTHLPELVIPHDHRYDFVTTVLSGAIDNVSYVAVDESHPTGPQRYNCFTYMTPLNGGNGFSFFEEKFLTQTAAQRAIRGNSYRSEWWQIHTLNIRCEGTILLLEQGPDELPLDVPSIAYRLAKDGKEPPSLDGLYDKMTPDHAKVRLNQFLDAIGNR